MISIPPVLGRIHIMPVIVEFQRAFPQIRMRVQMTDRLANLLEERVDLVLRIGTPPSSSLIGTRIGVLREVLCASPAYSEAARYTAQAGRSAVARLRDIRQLRVRRQLEILLERAFSQHRGAIPACGEFGGGCLGGRHGGGRHCARGVVSA